MSESGFSGFQDFQDFQNSIKIFLFKMFESGFSELNQYFYKKIIIKQ